MTNTKRVVKSSVLLSLFGLALLGAGCVVAPTEGYYDSGHHRYYHEHAWHDCGPADEHCR